MNDDFYCYLIKKNRTKNNGETHLDASSGWNKPFGQRHVPGYGGHVPDVTDHGTGMSFSEATHRLAGNYPNKVDAPGGVGRPEIWSSVAQHDYVSHTGATRHKWNDGMGAAGEMSDRGAIGAPIGSEELIKTLHPHQDKIQMKNPDGIDRDAPCRRAGAQTYVVLCRVNMSMVCVRNTAAVRYFNCCVLFFFFWKQNKRN